MRTEQEIQDMLNKLEESKEEDDNDFRGTESMIDALEWVLKWQEELI
jgi:hypothetical protein